MLRKDRIASDFTSGEPRVFASRAQLSKRSDQYHPLDGQLVPRSTDLGLLAVITAGEVPSCSDSEWLADTSKRGMYTLGDGSTTIRLPDWNGKSTDSVGALIVRGDGTNSAAAGVIQGDCSRDIKGRLGSTVATSQGEIADSDGALYWSGIGASVKTVTTVTTPEFTGTYDPCIDISKVVPTGPEYRMVNTAGVHATKR